MNETVLISIRVSVDLAERLADLAQTQRSKSFLAAQAIEEFQCPGMAGGSN